MSGQRGTRWQWLAAGMLLWLALGLGVAPAVQAEEPAARDSQSSVRLETLTAGYRLATPLGFRLVDTSVGEQVYRRADGSGPGLLWTAQFTSRWALTDDQLDRWSAQAIGLLVDGLAADAGADVRLAGWERLSASDVGDRRIGYRYALATAQGQPMGEATIVVFARGSEVGVSGAAVLGAGSAPDASQLARLLDGELAPRALAAHTR
jgi:hypothetical protein